MDSRLLNFDQVGISQVADIVLQTAVEHGFVDPVCNIDRKILLIVGELIEAQNEIRDGHDVQEIYYDWGVEGNHVEHDPLPNWGDKPEGFVIELADAVIRILDLAAELGLDIQEAIRLKAIFNDSRPYKHGKKF